MTYNEYEIIQMEQENLRLLEENNRLDFELSNCRRDLAILSELLSERTLISRRFKLEEAIMNCWTTMDDVDTLYKTVGDTDRLDDRDALLNYILGLHSIGSVKFENLFALYEDMVHNGEIK